MESRISRGVRNGSDKGTGVPQTLAQVPYLPLDSQVTQGTILKHLKALSDLYKMGIKQLSGKRFARRHSDIAARCV